MTSAQIFEKKPLRQVTHQMAPHDTFFVSRRFLNYWKPDLAIRVESEIWPRILLELKKIEFIKDAILELSVINDDLIVESLVKELSFLSGFSAQSIFSSIEKNKKTTRNKITTSQETINSKNNVSFLSE